MKRKLLFIVILLILSGCSAKEFDSTYEKMQTGKDGISGYYINLRIYGEHNGKRINENVKIENYNDESYRITKTSVNIKEPVFDQEDVLNEFGNVRETLNKKREQKEKLYVSNEKTYVIGSNGKYMITEKDVNYNNPSIYLKGLNKVSKIKKTYEKKVGDTTYKVYDVNYNKRFISNLVKDTIISDIDIKKEVTGNIYLTKENYVNRIIYNIEDVIINVNYYGIDLANSIAFPSEINRGN